MRYEKEGRESWALGVWSVHAKRGSRRRRTKLCFRRDKDIVAECELADDTARRVSEFVYEVARYALRGEEAQ